jgi:hypothetical protein
VDVSASCAIQAQSVQAGPAKHTRQQRRPRSDALIAAAHAWNAVCPSSACLLTPQSGRRASRSPSTGRAERPTQRLGREKDLGDQRVEINVFYVQLGSPSKDDGAGRHATIGQIRVRMGDETPEARTVQRKLKAPA